MLEISKSKLCYNNECWCSIAFLRYRQSLYIYVLTLSQTILIFTYYRIKTIRRVRVDVLGLQAFTRPFGRLSGRSGVGTADEPWFVAYQCNKKFVGADSLRTCTDARCRCTFRIGIRVCSRSFSLLLHGRKALSDRINANPFS